MTEIFDSSHLAFLVTQLLEPTRIATYDFLLVFHSNYGSISYHFQDKEQYLKNFQLPCI